MYITNPNVNIFHRLPRCQNKKIKKRKSYELRLSLPGLGISDNREAESVLTSSERHFSWFHLLFIIYQLKLV